MKNLLVVLETDAELERQIRSTLIHSFGYRVHHLLDVANDMLSHLGYRPESKLSEDAYLRETLIRWNDEHPYNRHKFYNALWERVRPLTRIGRPMCVMGLREKDMDHLLLRTTTEKVAAFTLKVSPAQAVFPEVVPEPTSSVCLPRESLHSIASAQATIGNALSSFGLF